MRWFKTYKIFKSLIRHCSEMPLDDKPLARMKARIKSEVNHTKDTFMSAINFGKYLFNAYQPPLVYPPYYIKSDDDFPFEVDILIVGGGLMGVSVAYWFKNLTKKSLTVCVLEKDYQYSNSPSLMSLGGIRQQFEMDENIQMSLFGSHFIKNASSYFELPIENINKAKLDFNPQGYLILASEHNSEKLLSNNLIQREYGSLVNVMTSNSLKNKFSWLNVDDLAYGSYGISNEGWFNPWQLLQNYSTYSTFWDTKFVQGELLGFEFEEFSKFYDPYLKKIQDIYKPHRAICNVRYADGSIRRKKIQFSKLVNAMGPHASRLAAMLDIGTQKYGREIALPVEPRKRYVYVVNCPDGPILDFPFLIDNSGLTIRRLDLFGNYLVLLSPQMENEPPLDSVIDIDYFKDTIWPLLSHRIPCFANLKIVNAWSSVYDYNYADQNPIIGSHGWYENVFFINGFSGYGAQHSPAAGRAIAELILYDDFQTIDLSKLGFERFIKKSLLFEGLAI